MTERLSPDAIAALVQRHQVARTKLYELRDAARADTGYDFRYRDSAVIVLAEIIDALPQLLALAQAQMWRDIASVPKGRIVIMFAVTDRHEDGRVANWKMATGSFSTYDNRLEWDGHVVDKPYDHRPTHWMPLPSPPPSEAR